MHTKTKYWGVYVNTKKPTEESPIQRRQYLNIQKTFNLTVSLKLQAIKLSEYFNIKSHESSLTRMATKSFVDTEITCLIAHGNHKFGNRRMPLRVYYY